jgi:hypothetical protein
MAGTGMFPRVVGFPELAEGGRGNSHEPYNRSYNRLNSRTAYLTQQVAIETFG